MKLNLQMSFSKISRRYILIGFVCFTPALLCLSSSRIKADEASAVIETPHYKFRQISLDKLPEQRVKAIGGQTPLQDGKLAYTGWFSFKDKSGLVHHPPYLSIVNINNHKIGKQEVFKATNVDQNYIFHPSFSPDGRYVTFLVGWPFDYHQTFEVYMLDTKTESIKLILKPTLSPENTYIFYPIIKWSPNQKYIAYCRGGYDDKLYIHNMAKQSDTFIDQSRLITDFSWTPQNTLLYSKLSKNTEYTINPKHAKIQEFFPKNGMKKLLLDGGFEPKPSPDGKNVTYWGWPEDNVTKDDKVNTSSEDTKSLQIGLYLYNRDTHKKSLLLGNLTFYNYITMLWTPDSKKIVFSQFLSRSPNAKAQIIEINIKTHKEQIVGIVTANDFKKLGRHATEPQVQPLSVTDDGKYMIFKRTEFVAPGKHLLDETDSTGALNLSDGTIINGAQVKTTLGFDWWNAQEKSTFTSTK